MSLRAYEVGVKGAPWGPSTTNAETAGKARYQYWLQVRDAWPNTPFTAVYARVAGPPVKTRAELAQIEADAFNAANPLGTVLRYWTFTKEGEPTGFAPISHPATVVCEHAVIWMLGVRGCVSLTHVERAAGGVA